MSTHKKSWKETVIERFDQGAQFYSEYDQPQKHIAEFLTSHLPEMKAPKVLELGCGTGNLTRHLFEKYPHGHFTISDASSSMLTATQKEFSDHENTKWIILDADYIQLEDNFDLIVSSMTMQWLTDWNRSLEKQKEHLNQEGQIFYAVPGMQTFKEWRNVLSVLGHEDGLLDFSKFKEAFAEEVFTKQYESGLSFLKAMKKMGAHTSRSGYVPLNPSQIKEALSLFEEKYQNTVSWHAFVGRVLS